MIRMKRLAFPAVLVAATSAAAQTLPAPQFAMPAANDSSSRAATTAWVRSLNLLSATGDLSQATVRAPGSSVTRTQSARAGDVYNVLDYGAVADGTTDIGPVLNTLATKLANSPTSNVIYFPSGVYRLASAVTFSGVAPILVGQGFTQGPGPNGTGSWVKIDQTGFTPITFSGTNARGAKVRDIAFYQIHPNGVSGWTPTNYDYVFRVLNTLGEVTFDNVLFAGVNRGIYADNSGRLNIKDVQGQFYTTGIEIDDCYDIPRIQRLHSWNFTTSNQYVLAYQQANQDTVLLRRVDGIFIGDIFSLAARSVIHMTTGTNGVTTKAYVSNLYADFTKYGIWIDSNNSTIQVANATTQHNDINNPGSPLPLSEGLFINATGVVAQISAWRSALAGLSGIDIQQYGNRVDIDKVRIENWNQSGAGAPAINVADSGGSTPNVLSISGQPNLVGGNGAGLINTSNAAATRSVLMNTAGNTVNEPRFYAAAAGNPVSTSAVGADATIDYYLGAKGAAGSVRLRSNNQTVLRLDDLNSSTDDLLLRGGAAALNLIAEGSEASIDLNLVPKGPSGGVRLLANGGTVLRVDDPSSSSDNVLIRGGNALAIWTPEGPEAAIDSYFVAKGNGSVRLQANGSTVLRVDNPSPSTSDVLVRSGSRTASFIAEDSSGVADLALTSIGSTGSTKLVANGTTVLRVDNPGAGDSDLLIRSGTGVASLTVESASASANLALVPKSTGVVTAPTPAVSDNSTTIATTAFVKAQAYASAASPTFTGTTSVTGTSNNIALAGATSGSGPTISATGADSFVDLNLSAQGGQGSVRLRSNGATVFRVDNVNSSSSGILVRGGSATASLIVEDGANVNANLGLNPKGSGVVTAPTPGASSNATTVATTAFVRSVLPCLQPQAGRAYTTPSGSFGVVSALGTPTTQPLTLVPIVVCGSRLVTGLAFEITAAAGSAFNARMALYADNNGVPGGVPLADTGTLAIGNGANGVQIGPIVGGPTIGPGIYWAALQTSYLAAPASLRAVNASAPGGVSQALGYSLTTGANSGTGAASSVYVNQTFGAPPNPLGLPSGYEANTNSPLVWVVF